MSNRVFVALGLVALAGGMGALNGFANSAAPAGTSSGPLLSSAEPGRAMIHADNLTPGAERTGLLTIVNDGADARLKLRTRVRDVAGPRGGELSDELLIEIRDARGGKHGPRIWAGELRDEQMVAALWLPAGASRTLRVTARLPRDASDDIQGAASMFELNWER